MDPVAKLWQLAKQGTSARWKIRSSLYLIPNTISTHLPGGVDYKTVLAFKYQVLSSTTNTNIQGNWQIRACIIIGQNYSSQKVAHAINMRVYGATCPAYPCCLNTEGMAGHALA